MEEQLFRNSFQIQAPLTGVLGNRLLLETKENLPLTLIIKSLGRNLCAFYLLCFSLQVFGEEPLQKPEIKVRTSFASSNYDGDRFNNPRLPREHHGLFDYLKMRWEDDFSPWPTEIPLKSKVIPSLIPQKTCCQFTFVGHATSIIQLGNLVLATDPILSERASPLTFLGPKRVRKPGVDFSNWPKIDFVLISHNHYDHLDIPTLKLIQERDHPTFLVGLGNKRLLESEGITSVIELDWGEKVELKDKQSITYLEAQHFSGRGLFDRNKALWGSFLIQAEAKRVYFAGDTGYSGHFLEQGSAIGEIDLAVLPIGAYLPRWFMKPMHIDPHEAVKAHFDLKSKKSIGIHFGTFQLTSEAIDDPLTELEKARLGSGLSNSDFIIPEFGETYQF